MNVHDCDVCLSAGSVNRWGICEICGEEFVNTGMICDWTRITFSPSRESEAAMAFAEAAAEEASSRLTAVGKNAA